MGSALGSRQHAALASSPSFSPFPFQFVLFLGNPRRPTSSWKRSMMTGLTKPRARRWPGAVRLSWWQMLIPFPPYRRNLRKKKTGRRREKLLTGSSAPSPATSMISMGGDEQVPGHPSPPWEVAMGSRGAHFQRGGHQKVPKGV